MVIDIPTLHETKDIKKIVDVLDDAFEDYPKLRGIFPDDDSHSRALAVSHWGLISYDLRYGKAYSLDPEVNEIVTILGPGQNDYTTERYEIATRGCEGYHTARNAMSDKEQRLLDDFNEELEELEDTVPIPEPYLYVNYLGVKKEMQGKGRGHRLMEPVCEFADSVNLPIMLFTHTDRAMAFYESLGFRIAKMVESETYKFQNWYLIRD